MSDIAIRKIHLALHGTDPPGCVYNNYRSSRGVCGLVVALSGESLYTFSDGRTQTLKAGEAALFSDSCAYIVNNISNEHFDHYTINFSLCEGCTLPSDEIYIKPESLDKYAVYCENILKYLHSPLSDSHLKCMSVLYETLSDFFAEASSDTKGTQGYKSISPAINYIEANYSKDISIPLLANLCMMSNTNFRRIFKQILKTSPIEYLLRVRICRASEFLSHTSYNISKIALMTGFKDAEHFCRSFKKRTGKTAGEFRKQGV